MPFVRSQTLELFPFQHTVTQIYPDVVYSVEGHHFACHKVGYYLNSISDNVTCKHICHSPIEYTLTELLCDCCICCY